MRQIGILVACGAILALGCDNGGGGDGGMIMLPDGGSGTDSGMMMTDAGTDAGPPPNCTLPASGGLSAECLPRCTRDTLTAAGMCGMDTTCLDGALRADTTPGLTGITDPTLSGVLMQLGEASLNCRACVILQGSSCLNEQCAAEIQACQTGMCGAACNVMGCDTQLAALNACQSTMAFQTCAQTRQTSCFQ